LTKLPLINYRQKALSKLDISGNRIGAGNELAGNLIRQSKNLLTLDISNN